MMYFTGRTVLPIEEIRMNDRANFRKFYRDTHATEHLTDREKKLIGLAVAIVRNCQS